MLSYLYREKEYAPWTAALASLEYVSNMIGSEALGPFMNELLKDVYTRNLWNTSDVWEEDVKEDYLQL